MDLRIIVLSGMPASGKDTVTLALTKKHPDFVHFKKHKFSISPFKETYINISKENFIAEINANNFLQYSERYGNYYGIHKCNLSNLLKSGKIPVIHSGRISGFKELHKNLNDWNPKIKIYHILLWQEMPVLEKRLRERERTEVDYLKRVVAANEEFQEFYKIENSSYVNYYIKNVDLDETLEIIYNITKEIPIETGYLLFQTYLNNKWLGGIIINEQNRDAIGIENISKSIIFTSGEDSGCYDLEQNQTLEIHEIGEEEKFFLEGRIIQETFTVQRYSGINIHFKNCIFRKNLKFSSLNLVKEIKFENCIFEKELIFHEVTTPLLEFIGTESYKIKLSGNTSFKNVKFMKSTCTDFLAQNLHELKNFSITFSEIISVKVVSSNGPESLTINNSTIEFLILSKYPTYANVDSSLKQLEIQNVKFSNNLFKKELKDVFNKKGANKTELPAELLKKMNFNLALYNSFNNRNQFEEADQTLYRVRIINNYYKQATSKTSFDKLYFKIVGFIGQYGFGWGIKISQNILTSFFLILAFAVFYTFRFPLDEKFFITFFHHLTQSTLLFFDAGSPEEYYDIYGAIEEILGIFMITILTGVLVRKIIK